MNRPAQTSGLGVHGEPNVSDDKRPAPAVLRYALDSLTVETCGVAGRTGRLEINTGSVTPAVLGPVDALELATILARWGAEEIAHRRLTRKQYTRARHHFPKQP